MPVFVFTDIEGSTGLWERHKEAMGPVIARHYALMDESVPHHGGRIIKKTGDGIFALFPDPAPDAPCAALVWALEQQKHFQWEEWPVVGELRVRMGFHVGEAAEMAGDFYGPTANRTARFMSVAWGGQVIVSEELFKQAVLPSGASWLDLGVHQVKDLPEPQHIHQMVHPDLKLNAFPPLKSLSKHPHNLPGSLSPFVGRQKELQEVAARLADPGCRLLTVFGAGGSGKTRLVIEAGRRDLERFSHGVGYVDLSELASPDGLAPAIAAALKFTLYAGQDPRAQVLDLLKDRQQLLILDGFDRLAPAAGWLAELLEAAPKVKLLVATATRLHLKAETVLELRGLDLPAQPGAADLEQSGAGKLFLQQAVRLNPGFALKPEERPALARVCALLGGLPLGLELAAGWTRTLPLKNLAERLERDLRFLSSTRQDLPERQRSLKALFEHAWQPLAAREREALARLSTMRGSFTLAAAQAVARAPLEALTQLADRSLLRALDNGRHLMPELVRQFAAAKLDESPAKRDEALDLHARHYCRLCKERERGVAGLRQAEAVAELRDDLANARQAWDRAVDKAWVREIGQAARCLGLFTDMQGLSREWAPRMEKALKLWDGNDAKVFPGVPVDETQATHAALQAMLANYLFTQGQAREALKRMEAGLALARRLGRKDLAAYALVRVAVFLGPEDGRRRPCLDEAMALYRELGDVNGAAWAKRSLGHLLICQGQAREGRGLVEEALAVLKEQGNDREAAGCVKSLAQASLDSGDAAAGVLGLKQARELYLALGDVDGAAWTLNTLGQAALRHKAFKDAKAAMEQALRLFTQAHNLSGRTLALRNLCEIEVGLGDLAQAYRMVDQIVADTEAAEDWNGMGAALIQKGRLFERQGELDQALDQMEKAHKAFVKAGALQGQARALECQAGVLLAKGQSARARNQLEQALQAFTDAGLRDAEARVQVRLADLDSAEGKAEKAENGYIGALKVSRYVKLGDYSLAALRGFAALFHKQGRFMEALRLVLVCERAFSERLLPAPDPGFYAEAEAKNQALLGQLGSRIMGNVIDEQRAAIQAEDLRKALKELVDRHGV